MLPHVAARDARGALRASRGHDHAHPRVTAAAHRSAPGVHQERYQEAKEGTGTVSFFEEIFF